MKNNDRKQHARGNESEARNTHKDNPLRVLSTSLGVVLAANLLLTADVHGEPMLPPVSDQPKLVEWSSEPVKAYVDANTDWNIPYPVSDKKAGDSSTSTGATAVNPSSDAGDTQVIVHNGGFGWNDLLLYHLIFNSGRSYSPSGWNNSHPVTDYRTNQPYRPKSFDAETFRNQPTDNSTVRPKTSNSQGTFTTRSGLSSSISGSSKSSSPGGIGGRSSSFSSSGSHSSGGSFGG